MHAGPDRVDERPWEWRELGVEGEQLKAVGRRQAIEEVGHGAA
jgi:hypothetical protein